ncbi:protein kinase domain-containing protein [Acinetobacter pragensis]|uniref:protein kinase domain-containing protein n=1 Tax=Acinetobacter pragensis TaxID=1806892 RepID=UPI003340CB22
MTLQWNEHALKTAKYTLMSKTRSLSFGRYLYLLQIACAKEGEEPVQVWLKGQRKNTGGFAHAEQGFLQELSLYQQWSAHSPSFLLPYQIVSIDQMNLRPVNASRTQPDDVLQIEQLYPQFLLLPHAQSVFFENPNQLSHNDITSIILQAVNALEKLAALGYLHADVKAEHFLSYEGQVRLIDFEQSIPINSEMIRPMNATPRYMAPELFHGQAKSIQSDIYALGIVLLEWLSGRRLNANSYEEWAYLHCQRLIIDLPEPFRRFLPLLQGMLMKQKTQRMRDFSQIKACLIAENA